MLVPLINEIVKPKNETLSQAEQQKPGPDAQVLSSTQQASEENKNKNRMLV